MLNAELIKHVGRNYVSRVLKGLVMQYPSQTTLTDLQASLAQAIANIPYYQQESANYARSLTSQSLSDFFSNLPILEKSTVKTLNNLFEPVKKPFGYRTYTTSGTTGSPLVISTSPSERLYGDALLFSEIQKVTGKWGWQKTLFLTGFHTDSSSSFDRFYTRDTYSGNVFYLFIICDPKMPQNTRT